MHVHMRKSLTLVLVLYYVISSFFMWVPSEMVQTEKVQAASYSPYDTEKTVYDQRWDKGGSNRDSPTSGKQIQYDIYQGSGTSNKQGYQIEQKDFGKGKETFLTFTGWSALIGYTHHTATNQSTYIVARNEQEGKEKMYRLQQTSLDASKDIEYNRKSSSGPITNRCPNGTYNKMNNTCNMDYKSVGFKAWIPLNDLFPDENKGGEWELYIVKRVGTGSRLNVVYDKLITPFEFSGKTFQKGSISLSSGENAKQLEMLVPDAVRRSAPRATDNGGNYFTKGKTYTAKTHSEKYTAVWYGVSSSHDGGATRWAASLYWRSQGKPATIRYDTSGKICPDGSKVAKSAPCTVDVTIRHVDSDTGQVLRTDKKKSTVGDHYSYKPATTGTFTNPAGIAYTATPSGQKFEGTTGNDNMTFTFTYRAKASDEQTDGNTKVELVKQGGDPQATGYFFWELRRTISTALSQAYVESKFNISSSHYATRNPKLTVTGPGIAKQDGSSVSFTTDAAALKDKYLSYNFTYEYTNYYRKIYVKEWYWVPGNDKNAGYYDWYWKYDHTETAWDKGDTFSLDGVTNEDLSVKVDHSQKETFDVNEMKDMQDVSLVVGKRQNWTNNAQTLNKTYYEKFSKPSDSAAKSENNLHAQTYFNMEPDRVGYEIELPSDEQKKFNFSPLLKEGSSGSYFPVDVDKSLQGHYAVADNSASSTQSNSVSSTSQSDTKYVTNQTSANYTDAEGYTGTLAPYVSNVNAGKTEMKYVTNQASVSYNQDGFTGTLSPYVYSGSYVPADTKTVTDSSTSTSNSFASTISYNSGGYSGTLYKSGPASSYAVQTGGYWQDSGYWQDTGYWSSSGYWQDSGYWTVGIVSDSMYFCGYYESDSGWCGETVWGNVWVLSGSQWVSTGSYWVSTGSYWVSTGSQWVPTYTTYYTQNYQGNVTKPSSDTRVWRYQGNVTKKSDATQEVRYQGYVTKSSQGTSNSTDKAAVSGNYAFPLQMSRLNRLGTNGNSTTYELNFVTDNFFMSKDFGYIGYYPYAERVKENLVSGNPLPTPSEMLNTVTQTTSALFKAQTRENFEDTFMYTDHTVDEGLYGTGENLQRYWIPIDATSPLENGVEYSNEIVLNNMGLSDVSFNFSQKFSFDHYLMGSVYDDVATWEQVEPRVDVQYPYTITLSPEERQKIMEIKRNSYALHGFRLVDTKRLYRELKDILHTSFGDWW